MVDYFGLVLDLLFRPLDVSGASFMFSRRKKHVMFNHIVGGIAHMNCLVASESVLQCVHVN